MFGRQFKAKNRVRKATCFGEHVALVVGKLCGKCGAHIQCKITVTHGLYAPENDNAFDVQRPFTVFSVPFVHNAERRFVAGGKGVDFMPDAGAMKVYFAVIGVVIMRHRQSVRIAVVADERKHAAGFVFQYFNALFAGKFLFESSHFSEHIFSPETVFVARRVFAMSKPICGCTYGTCLIRRRNAPRKDIPSRRVRKTRCGR